MFVGSNTNYKGALGMEELKIYKEQTKEIFVNAFKERNLVPILGAGFTVGMPTLGKRNVPDGKMLKKYMINKILKKQTDIGYDEIENENFSSVAELFEKCYPDVQEDDIARYFHEHFTGIRINKVNQLRFINEINWEYVYTLNIDTGIEDTNKDKWEVFYPNKDFDERNCFMGKKKVYKIHGDASRFVKTSDYKEMILTESQYIYSLEKNKKFHDMLAADCENKNILYIGCSLNDEIDIKYSVLSDKNRNYKDKETYRIYVTTEPMTSLKKAKLDGYNISHYILLQNIEDYELFYEFLYECYKESKIEECSNVEGFYYKKLQSLSGDTDENIRYLADLGGVRDKLPYYYYESEMINKLTFSLEKINVISGRRFVGKTMLAYNILDHFPNYRRYYIASQESVDTQTIRELMELTHSLIVFDSDSVDDKSFIELINSFNSKNKNIVCIFMNSYDDVLNLVSYHALNIHQPINHNLIGKMHPEDLGKINAKLHEIGIATFSSEQIILDNTLRIANVYSTNLVTDYMITTIEELEIIIWLLVQNKIYYEEIVSLGLSGTYKGIVKKFAPFLQEEKCKTSELRKHSTRKIVCNGKLGLLQILNSYTYPNDNDMGKTIAKTRHRAICDSIYSIMYAFDKVDRDRVKKFIMFDTLNDIFSRKYSSQSITFIQSNGKKGKVTYGAAGLIQQIYSDSKIQKLKAGDPNYWLQRAKSVYITYHVQNNNDTQELYEGIKWALKAEQDSSIKIMQGEKHYNRTLSNATIQIAMMYGRLARLKNYSVIGYNNKAVEYYYKGLSDANNSAAAKSLIHKSKGTEDLKSLICKLGSDVDCIDYDWRIERDYLLNIRVSDELVYSI